MVKLRSLIVFLSVVLLQFISIVPIVSAQEYMYYDWWIFSGLCFFWVIIWFIIWIFVAIWVYKDAEKRGSNGILWLILVLLLGIIAIIIWLVIRPPIGGAKKTIDSDRRCPNCGRVIPMDARVCPYCGKKFEDFL